MQTGCGAIGATCHFAFSDGAEGVKSEGSLLKGAIRGQLSLTQCGINGGVLELGYQCWGLGALEAGGHSGVFWSRLCVSGGDNLHCGTAGARRQSVAL